MEWKNQNKNKNLYTRKNVLDLAFSLLCIKLLEKVDDDGIVMGVGITNLLSLVSM